MGWSINPSSLASIDQNGVLSYQQHTSDITYEISYSDDDCTTSKSVTIYACTPCNCADLTVTGKTDISKDSGDNVTIGTFSKASCMSNPRASSSTSWLSNLSVSGNDIKATVEANSESSSRNGSVTVTVDKEGGGTCEKTMSITQSAGGGGTKTLMVPYTISFTNVEKGTFVVKLKTQYDSKEITVDAGGGPSTSGSSSGNARLIVPEEWDVATAIANVEVDKSDMVLTIRHNVYNFDMRWDGVNLNAEISSDLCPSAWNPWPDTCGQCKVCADVRVSRGTKINVVATGGGGFVP